jgi:hypothetical protein
VKKASAVLFLFLFLSAFSVLLTFGTCEAGKILYVGGIEIENYRSIQYAINDASEGDQIADRENTVYGSKSVRK